MTARQAAAVASVLGLMAALLIVVRGGTGAAPGAVAPARPAASRAPAAAEAAGVTAPVRNVFEYAAGEPPPDAAPPPDIAATVPPPAALGPPPPAPVRLVGLVRRGGGLKAAVSIEGRVVVLGAGESAEGYTALSVDEERGARLRGPDGTEMVLPVPVS